MQGLPFMKQVKTNPGKRLLDKNVENMVEFYRVSLLRLLEGGTIVDSIPKGTRKRLIEYGILRKFGTKFELTDRGTTILQKNSC